MKRQKKSAAFWLGFCKVPVLFLLAFGFVTQNRAMQILMAVLLGGLCVIDVVLDRAEKKGLKNDHPEE